MHRHPPLFFQQDSHNVPLTCLPRQARLPRRASEQAPSWRPMNHLHCEAVSLTEVGSSWPKDAQNGTHSASRLAHAGSPIEERHDAAGITKRPVHHALFALPRSRPDLVLKWSEAFSRPPTNQLPRGSFGTGVQTLSLHILEDITIDPHRCERNNLFSVGGAKVRIVHSTCAFITRSRRAAIRGGAGLIHCCIRPWRPLRSIGLLTRRPNRLVV